MKRRIASKSLLIAAAAAAADGTSWLGEHRLSVRSDMEHELRFLSTGEFAPPPPARVRRAMQAQGQGVMQREQGNPGGTRASSGGGVVQREGNDCSSPLVTWTTQQVRDMGYEAYKTLHDNKVIQMAYVYKHYIDKNENEEYFVNDAQTEELKRRHRDTIAFWEAADIDNTIITGEILLLSMHGSDLADNAKLVPAIQRIFDFDAMADVLAFAAKVQRLVADLPRGYDNPLLTMNAVATRSTYGDGHSDPSRRTKDSIVIGDGVLQFLYENGLESSGPDFVHAHEFGHHLQFRMMDNAARGGTPSSFADDDRAKELMADAVGGYFLAHDRGADMVAEEIGVFDRTAFSTGDCGVESGDHHGTPAQRRCAAVWGASRAAPDRAPLLDAEEFVHRFEEAYNGILNLDGEECKLVLEETTSLDYDPPQEYEEEDEWTTTTAGAEEEVTYNVDDKEEGGEPALSIEDWLDSIEKQNKKSENWEKVPDNEDVVSLKPIGITESSSTESQGKPSHFPPLDRGDADAARLPNDEKEMTLDGGDGGASTNLADAGSPAQTKHLFMRHDVTIRDCHLPWVYCDSSSATPTRVGFPGRPSYIISVVIAAALLISS